MPPTMGSGNRFHNIGTDYRFSPEIGIRPASATQTVINIWPETVHGAFDYRFFDILMMQSSARFEPVVYNVLAPKPGHFPNCVEFGPSNCRYPAECLRSGARHSGNESSGTPARPT